MELERSLVGTWQPDKVNPHHLLWKLCLSLFSKSLSCKEAEGCPGRHGHSRPDWSFALQPWASAWLGIIESFRLEKTSKSSSLTSASLFCPLKGCCWQRELHKMHHKTHRRACKPALGPKKEEHQAWEIRPLKGITDPLNSHNLWFSQMNRN